MNSRQRVWVYALCLLFLSSCAAWSRGCSSCMAKKFGADWVVVELTEADAIPYRCWELRGASVENEPASDGIYWKNNKGNLVHVAGSYDYVQVDGGDWDDAFAEVNLTQEACATIRARRFDTTQNKYVTPKVVQ